MGPFLSEMSQQGNFILFFFPLTRQKYACQDMLTVKYTECSLIAHILKILVSHQKKDESGYKRPFSVTPSKWTLITHPTVSFSIRQECFT